MNSCTLHPQVTTPQQRQSLPAEDEIGLPSSLPHPSSTPARAAADGTRAKLHVGRFASHQIKPSALAMTPQAIDPTHAAAGPDPRGFGCICVRHALGKSSCRSSSVVHVPCGHRHAPPRNLP
jgi:hypothetical protein